MSQVFADVPQGFNSAVEALNSLPQDILAEMTSRNLSDKWLRHLLVKFIHQDSDTQLMQRLINIGSLVKTQPITTELNLEVLFLNQSGNKCQDAAAFLQYKIALLPVEQYQKCLLNAGISYDAKLLFNAISYIFRSAAKVKLPADKLTGELKSSLCWKDSTLSVIKHVWNEQGKILSSSDLAHTLNVGQLLDMKWKLSVGVSSSACRSLNSPYITALVTVTDPSGRLLTKSFEMTIGEFKKFAAQMREIASVLETV